MSDVIDRLRAHPVLAIMRGVPAEHVTALAQELVDLLATTREARW